MKKTIVFSSLTLIFIVIGLLHQIWFVPEMKANAVLPKLVTCHSETCTQMAADILRSTVRLHLTVWQVKPDESGYDWESVISHATLRDGRFLVTHNHYAPLEQTSLADVAISMSVYNSTGQFLFSAPLTDFEVTEEADETLVFEIKNDYIMEQLAASGITSAKFKDWPSLQLQPGMEVAQVDWNGRVSRVDWTTIDKIITEERIPRLVLNDGVTKGSSGGGIFWNGIHIANNWLSLERMDDAGNVHAISVAPLNGY